VLRVKNLRRDELAEPYDVTIATVRPGTHPQALAALDKTLAGDSNLLACWYSEIGALNRILIIRKSADAAKAIANRFAALSARNPFGIGEFITDLSLDTYLPFDFMPALQGGAYGPCYEVRSYVLKPDGDYRTVAQGRAGPRGRVAATGGDGRGHRCGDPLHARLAL
jgi:hypothetical protein